MARSAGSTRSSCHGVPQTRRLAAALGEGVGEDDGPLLGQPERRFVATASVVERDQAARQLAPGLDRLEVGLGDVVAPEEARAEGSGAVALDDPVDVADVVGLQHDGHRGGAGVEPGPDSVGPGSGTSASMTTTSPPDSTHVEVTAGSQPTCGAQSGCSTRQIQRPAATSRITGGTADILADGVGTMGVVKLEPLYRVEFVYPEGWSIELAGEHGSEWQDFYLAEGTCAGRVAGRMRGANHPRRRTDGTYCPDFQGVIETADGAEVMFDWRGYGRAYPGRRAADRPHRHPYGGGRALPVAERRGLRRDRRGAHRPRTGTVSTS